MRKIRFFPVVVAVPLMFAALVGPVTGQSPEWAAQLTVSAFPSPFLSEWERNPQMLRLAVTFTGQGERSYVVQGTVRSGTGEEVARAESPPLMVAAGPTVAFFDASDLYLWRILPVRRTDVEQAVRTGVLPEGEYELCARLIGAGGLQLAEDCAPMDIILPEPPELIFPGPGDGVSVIQPTLQWTPVSVPLSLGLAYRVRVVERLPSQTPLVALEANIPHLDERVSGAPFLQYPADGIPLEAGKEYVWQVEALDGMDTPLRPGGLRSEISTFRAQNVFAVRGAEDEDIWDSFDLIPGVARLNELSQTERLATAFGMSFEGTAELELLSPVSARFDVRVRDLVVDELGMRVTSGEVTGSVAGGLASIMDLPPGLDLERIAYRPETGLTAEGRFALPGRPNDESIELSGALQITGVGLFGRLEGRAAHESATRLGGDPLAVRLIGARAFMPEGVMELEGEVEALGTPTTCRLHATLEPDGGWNPVARCAGEIDLPLAQDASRAGITLVSLAGSLEGDLTAGALDGALTATGVLSLDGGVTGCFATLDLQVGTEGVDFDGINPLCGLPGSEPVPLDWLALALGNLRVDRLSYIPGSGLDLALRVDMTPRLPSLPELVLPSLMDVAVTPEGLRVAPMDEPAMRNRVQVAGLAVTARRVRSEGFTIPWTDWDAESADAVALEMELGWSLPDLPASAPNCLAGGVFTVSGAALADGRLSGDVGGTAFSAGTCRIPMGGGAELEVLGLEGTLSLALAPEPSLVSVPGLMGVLHLPDTFRCGGGENATIPISAGSIQLHPDGRLEGSVAGISPCPVASAGVELGFREGVLTLSGDMDGPRLTLGGEASVRMAATEPFVSASGTVMVDLIEGVILDGSLLLDEPFRLHLPAEQPALSFVIQSAELDARGLHVDGRAGLDLPGDGIVGATFVGVTLEVAAPAITQGQVLFDAPFALDAGFDDELGVIENETGTLLTWRAVAPTDPFELMTGARLVLPEGAVLESGGLRVSGQADATLRLDDREVGRLAAAFDDAFLLGLRPVEVEEGRVDLFQDGIGVAHIDETGLHLNLAQLGAGVIPERLGLPSEAVAWLELRGPEGRLLVDATDTDEGTRLLSRPGEPVRLILPVLNGSDATDPELRVSFDLLLDRDHATPLDGEIRVATSDGPLTAVGGPFDLSSLGLPFLADSVSFTAAAGEQELALAGRFLLQGISMDAGESVRLAVSESGRLRGDITAAVATPIPFVEGSDRLVFRAGMLEAGVDLGLLSGEGSWSLDLQGDIEFMPGEGEPYRVSANLRSDDTGVAFTSIAADGPASTSWFDAGPVRVGVGNLRVPRLEWDAASGWDFELLVDLGVRPAGFDDLDIPPATQVVVDRDGLIFPALSVGEMPARVLPLAGFRVTPLSLRSEAFSWNPFDGGQPEGWAVSMDLEVRPGADAVETNPSLAELRLTVLDATWQNGLFTGEIEARSLLSPLAVPIGATGMGLELRQFRGNMQAGVGVQLIEVEAAGGWTRPTALRCDSVDVSVDDLPGAWFALSGDGSVQGSASGIVPPCPLMLGPLAVAVETSELTVAWGGGEERAELALQGALRLPAPDGVDSIAAPGSIQVDLLTGRVVGGEIAVAEPFLWDLPATGDPLLRFVVDGARLDATGFRLDGSGTLPLGGGANVGVTFDGLGFTLPDMAIGTGRASFQAAVALDARITAGRLDWSFQHPDTPRGEGSGFRMVTPAGMILDAEGLRVSGEGSAAVNIAGEELAELALTLDGDFRLGLEPLVVAGGRGGFLLDGTEVAYLDPTGFWPGDIFGVLPLPVRLGLPAEEVAYLQLRDSATDEPLVETGTVDGGIRISGTGVALVLPALAGAAAPPSVALDVDVVVNPVTFALVSGELRATGGAAGDGSIFDLTAMGLPLDVRSLVYAQAAGANPEPDSFSPYRLSLGGRVILPGSLDGMELRWDGVSLTSRGLSGTVAWGSLAGAGSDVEPTGDGSSLALVDFGHLAVGVDGLNVDFDTHRVALAGRVELPLFAGPDGTPEPIPFTAAISAAGSLEADLGLPDGIRSIPLGVAAFEPMELEGTPPLELTFAADDFAMRVGGVLRMPSLGSDFALSIPGIEVNRSGVRIREMALQTEQELALFGATFRLREIGGTAPLVVELLDADVLALTLSGDVAFPFLEQRPAFRGLRVATDGSLTLAAADLLTEPVTVVPDLVTLAEIVIDEGRLNAGFDVVLPPPLEAGEQRFQLHIDPDGTVAGGGVLTLVDAEPSLSAARPEGVPVAAQIRYLGLDLELGSGGLGSVQAVADLYLGGRESNRIKVGERTGGTVLPGLRIGFDGSVQWGNVSLARTFEFDYDLLKLSLENVSFAGQRDGFQVGFGGELRVAIPSLEGALRFTDFRVDDQLRVAFSPTGVEGGDLTIGGVVGLSLTEFGYSDTPQTIQVAAGAMPSGDSEVGAPAIQDIEVDSYLRFGGSMQVLDFAGGMEEVLFFRQGDDVAFVLRDAELIIPHILRASADFRYFTRGAGFELLVAADASVLETVGGSLAGIIEVSGDGEDPRAALFVAVEAQVPLLPPLFLGGMGGGVFYNPRQEHIDFIASRALGSGVRPAAGPAGKFTAMLYAGVEIVDATVASGSILLTGSEAGARLQGKLDVLDVATGALSAAGAGSSSGNSPLSGSLDVQVGFRQRFLEGNLQLDIDMAPLVSGGAQTAFFVYGEDAWGLSGEGQLEYMKLLNGTADFFVGPPGFMVGATLDAGFDFWIVRLDADAEVAAWYQRAYAGNPQDFGAYFEAMVQAGILGDAVTASGTLRGAMLSGPLIYAGARVEGCVAALGCRDANIWAKLTEGGISGGFGSDPTMSEIIARANGVRTSMAGARSSLEEEMALARPAAGAVLPSEQEIVAAFQRLTALDFDDFQTEMERAFQVEGGDSRSFADRTYQSWYMNLFGVGSKDVAYRVDAGGYAQRAEDALAGVEALRTPVLDRMAAISTNLIELREAAEITWPNNPLRSVSFAPPTSEFSIDAEGNEVKVMTSGPGFQLDAAAAEEERAAAAAHETETRALVSALAGLTLELDQGLAEVQSALGDPTAAGVLRFAELHAETLEATEAMYAYWGNLVLQEQDQKRLDRELLVERATALQDRLQLQSLNYRGAGLEALVRGRLNLLADWTDTPSMVVDFENLNHPDSRNPEGEIWWRNEARTLGFQIWHTLALLGLADADTRYAGEFDAVRNALLSRPAPVRAHVATLTTDIHSLQRLHAELTGTVYDLYDRYGSLIESDESVPAEEKARVQSRKEALERALTVPRITQASVDVTSLGYLLEERFSVAGFHPAGGVREFLFDNRSGGPAASGFLGQNPTGLLTGGPRSRSVRYSLIPGRGHTSSETRTFRTGGRGGAGYLGFGLTTYQVGWAGGVAIAPAGPVTMNVTTTPPRAPTPRFMAGTEWSTRAAGHWVGETDRLDLNLSGAYHLQSGITEIQYAVGTAGDTTAVREWTSVGGRTEVAVHGLELRTDEANLIYARALAGNDVWSPVSVSVPLRYDPSPAVFQPETDSEGEYLSLLDQNIQMMEALAMDFGTLDAAALPVCTLPDPTFLHGGSLESELDIRSVLRELTSPSGRNPAPVPPTLTVARPSATDPESGVAGFAWALQAGSSPGPYQGEGWALIAPDQSEILLGGPDVPLDYAQEFFLAVVAQNGAGTFNFPVVKRLRVPDPSAPLPPLFCLRQQASTNTRLRVLRDGATPDIRIEFQDRAVDPETGIAGYEYRIRTTDGTVVRPWPETPDWTSVEIGDARIVTPPAAPDGTRYYVDIRVRNGQGFQAISTSGPLLLDASAPPAPAVDDVRLVKSMTTQVDALEVDVSAPNDPHSGLRNAHHQYSLHRFTPDQERADGPLGFLDGGTIDPDPILFNVFAGATTGSYTARIRNLTQLLEPGASYALRIRTVNGANLPSRLSTWIFTVR